MESGIRSVELPTSLKIISQASFALCNHLKTAKFSDGLEILGTDEYTDSGDIYLGVFERSALEYI